MVRSGVKSKRETEAGRPTGQKCTAGGSENVAMGDRLSVAEVMGRHIIIDEYSRSWKYRSPLGWFDVSSTEAW